MKTPSAVDLNLFFVDSLKEKRKKAFHQLLAETKVNTTSSWKEIRRKIKEDIRYQKFSSSERKKEREFNEYIDSLGTKARQEFQEMLEECRLITYETEGNESLLMMNSCVCC